MTAATAARSRNSILDVAVRLFGQQGYTGTSMRDIAKAVGVLPGSLYAHIDSKETLLAEIVDEGIRRFLQAIEPIARRPLPSEERLRLAVIAHVEVVAQNPERSQVVFHQWRYLKGEALAEAVAKRRRYEQAFLSIIEAGREDGTFEANLNVRVAVLTVLGALNWTPEWYSPAGRLSPTELGHMMANTLLRGLISRR